MTDMSLVIVKSSYLILCKFSSDATSLMTSLKLLSTKMALNCKITFPILFQLETRFKTQNLRQISHDWLKIARL